MNYPCARGRGGLNLNLFRAAALLAVVAFPTGCESVQGFVSKLTAIPSEPRIDRNVGPKLAPAQLPRYRVGRFFTFDDGRRETVLRSKGEVLTWRKNRFSTAVVYRNFLIPPMSWETRTRKSRSQITARPRMLWPLRVGND
jgi:hypothetical protein